ncbi:MAG: S8 family serine peptidase [Actinomycetota bacterium]|nr:S8 family serine peptidase [Actinomycetota bacterium]
MTAATWHGTRRTAAPRRSGRALAALAGLAVAVPAVFGGVTSAAASADGPDTQLVLRATPGSITAVAAEVRRLGGTVSREMRTVDTLAVSVSGRALATLRHDARVLSATPDAALTLSSAGYDALTDPYSMYTQENVGAVRPAWKNANGQGVDVALIDSGVAPVAGLNDAGKVLNGPDLSPESQNPATQYLDTFGHGTHMAGIIAGHDTGVAVDTRNTTDYLGVAPNARIISVKAADAHGTSDVSQVIAGIDWVVQHAHDPGMNIRVLNLSFGTDAAQSYALDPLAFATEVAWRAGIVVVVSAGNRGNALGHLDNPALDPFVVAVGAADTNGTNGSNDDTVASFSSAGDGVRNPDVVAPGVHAQGLRVPGSYLDLTYGSTATFGDRFFRGSGTSQAAAYTSGVVADLLSLRSTLSPDQVKWLLTNSAKPLPTAIPATLAGRGLVNLNNALWKTLPLSAAQTAAPGVGTGLLEAARGSAHLVLNGVTLSGEQDLMGQPFTSAGMAGAELSGSAWAGGTWNGSAWAGSAWAGSSWAGSAWAGNSWAGNSWAGSAWAGSAWAGTGWSGSAWAGSAWAGSAWAGSAWAGSDYGSATPGPACAPSTGRAACKSPSNSKRHGFGQDEWK